MEYLIGQKVILNNKEIGKVVTPERMCGRRHSDSVWVFSPSKNYASEYSVCNIKPLPNGQL